MIRNPRCMYYVPYKPKEKIERQFKSMRPEMELPEFELEGNDDGAPPGVRSSMTGVGRGTRLSTAAPVMENIALDWDSGLVNEMEDGSEDDDDYETDDDDDGDEEACALEDRQ